jgi:hypothetical protein
MANEVKKDTVKMKYVGHFKGTTKTVELPIPLVSNSMKQEEVLTFSRTSKNGAAYCEVPMRWVGALLAVGGNWQLAETVTPDLKSRIEVERAENDERMRKFALENELVEA